MVNDTFVPDANLSRSVGVTDRVRDRVTDRVRDRGLFRVGVNSVSVGKRTFWSISSLH